MSFVYLNKDKNSVLMNSQSEEQFEDKISDEDDCVEGKKSVEDILAGTQEAIGNLNLNQAITNLANVTLQPITSSSLSNQLSSLSSSSSSGVSIKSSNSNISPHNSPKLSARSISSTSSSSVSSTTSGSKTTKSELFITSNNCEKIEDQIDQTTTVTATAAAAETTTTTTDFSAQGSSSSSSSSNSNNIINESETNLKFPIQENIENKPIRQISKVSDRAKKKSWYNVLYPSYKSRSEDFKKLFKDVPDDERLVVDYSCAVQRDILVHGRLYVSQNYLCFYANIFRWETCLCMKWKDVTSITKEKTARVIPNAISISAGNDKYFFTSFTTRDKAYLMLFRVWQNALMDKQMQPQEMWQWVHNCYGDELGLTSDDEDYIDPYLVTETGTDITSTIIDTLSSIDQDTVVVKNKSLLETISSEQDYNNITSDIIMGGTVSDSRGDDSEVSRKSHQSKSEKSSSDGQSSNNNNDNMNINSKFSSQQQLPTEGGKKKISKNSRQRDETLLQQGKELEQLPTDMSDSSDSDNKNVPFISTAECTSMHEGRQLVHTILPINIDNLFNLLFSKSKFLVDFHTVRKSTDMVFGEWIIDPDGIKKRTFKVTVALTQSVGPKTAQVTETQIMRECSQPSELYSIDVSSVNAGIPYADSFCVDMHYCLVRTVDDHTMLSVHAQIKYKKSVWGVVKGFIEKNTWAGLEDFYNALLRALQSEYCIPPAKAKGRRPRRNAGNSSRTPSGTASTIDEPIMNSVSLNQDNNLKITSAITNPITQQFLLNEPKTKYKWLSWFVIGLLTALILLNIVLLFKLWKLENRNLSITQAHSILTMKNLPKNHKDWIELLKQQETLHETEMRKWQIVLQTAIELLKKVSIVCKTIVNSGNLTEFISNIHNEL